MNLLELEEATRARLHDWTEGPDWLVACLCARWCDQCEAYRATFNALAERNPGLNFAWIDIEDHAALVGGLDVENFPTLLLQRTGEIYFFGALPPQMGVAAGVIAAIVRDEADGSARPVDAPAIHLT